MNLLSGGGFRLGVVVDASVWFVGIDGLMLCVVFGVVGGWLGCDWFRFCALFVGCMLRCFRCGGMLVLFAFGLVS